MATTTEVTVLVHFLVLVSMLTNGVRAGVKYTGQEPDPRAHDAYRWVIPVPDPCESNGVHLGGVNTLAPRRPFKVRYHDDLLHSNEPAEIRKALNCTEGENERCLDPLGMEDGSIPDASITASSIYPKDADYAACLASNGRLNYPCCNRPKEVGGWCSATADGDDWLQVDLGKPVQVEGVIIQGSLDPYDSWVAYVKTYQVKYSHDESTWSYVTQEINGGEAQTFTGNTDLTTPVTSMFDKPIQARYIRILPITSNDWHCMRIELIGCKAQGI